MSSPDPALPPRSKERPRQYDSHTDRLAPFRAGRSRLGGIVTSATRDTGSVLNTVRLAAQLGVPVVVLCSKGARPDEIARKAAELGADCTAVDLDSCSPEDLLPSFYTDKIEDATSGAYGDLSLKRNLGLLIGRLAGWSTLLFLDDDLSDLNPMEVRRAVGSLQHYAAVGMPAEDFPDNSVVCHARRFSSGAKQGVFVSGSALAVDVQAADSFFPRVYNEDWLFLTPLLERQAVTRYGSVKQAFFNPFDSPERAVRQEFGDVLAEGLVGYLHSGCPGSSPSRAYWREFLTQRAEVIAAAAAGCRPQTRVNPYARDALSSLKAAEAALTRISPALLAFYVEAWRADLEVWRAYLAGMGRLGSLDGALKQLRLVSVCKS